jgi:hypothetical protein
LAIFTSIQYPESGKHFQGSEMCAIDFPHKVIHKEVISKEKEKQEKQHYRKVVSKEKKLDKFFEKITGLSNLILTRNHSEV